MIGSTRTLLGDEFWSDDSISAARNGRNDENAPGRSPFSGPSSGLSMQENFPCHGNSLLTI